MTCALLLAIPAVAFADDVYNNLDPTIDADAENINLTEGGSNDPASVLIKPTNGDGKNGCNLTSSSTLKVKAVSSDSTKVTASLVNPDNTSVAKDTFTSCGDSIKVKVEALAATGTTPVTISLEQVSNTTDGTFNLDPAKFTVNVASTKQNTSISNVSGSGTYGGDADLTAKLTSGTNNLSGKTVAFKLNGESVGTDATDANGVAELPDVSLAGINAGTHTGGVSASFDGDSGYNGSNSSAPLTIGKAATTTTTVTCGASLFTYDGSPHTPCSASVTGQRSGYRQRARLPGPGNRDLGDQPLDP